MKKINILWITLVLLNLSTLSQAQVNETAFFTVDNFTSSKAELPGDLVYIPFELNDGKVYVNAKLNGVQGKYILDTGAPGIVINSDRKEKTAEKGKGVTGDFSFAETTVEQFEWAGMRIENSRALVLDISHLEEGKESNLAGLIGYDILKKAEVLFDYPNRRIIMYKDRKSSWHKGSKPQSVIDFEMLDHLPVIKSKIGKKTVHLGIDCGAQSNILDTEVMKKVSASLVTKSKKERLVGLNKTERKGVAVWLESTSVGKEEVGEMKYVLSDFKGFETENGTELNGLLGFPFFEQAVFSINYKKRKIYIWSLKN